MKKGGAENRVIDKTNQVAILDISPPGGGNAIQVNFCFPTWSHLNESVNNFFLFL